MNKAEMMSSSVLGQRMGALATGYQDQRNDLSIAIQQGRKFIVLLHKTQSNIAERINYVEGIKVRQYCDGQSRTRKYHCLDAQSVPCLFIPDPATGNRIAHLLDTPRNRQMLATHLPDGRWTIVDDGIRAEIEDLAKGIKPVWDSSQVQIRANQQPVDASPKLTEEETDDLIKQYEDHISKLRAKKNTDNSETGSDSDNTAKTDEDKAREKVHRRFSTVLNRIKKTYGEHYEKSKEYQDTIAVEIEKELAGE